MPFASHRRLAIASVRATTVALVATLLALALAACGQKGDPLPPLRREPAPTTDLSVHQQGSVLIFRFAYPQTTRSGGALGPLAAVEIFDFAVAGDATAAGAVDDPTFARLAKSMLVLEGAELRSATTGDRIEARIQIPEGMAASGAPQTHLFAVRTQGESRESSLFSNRVPLAVHPEISAPGGLTLEARADGVAVSWSAASLPDGSPPVGYHVYRRAAVDRGWGAPLALAESGQLDYLDQSAQFGQRYIYTVRAVATVEPLVESAAAVEREIDHVDRFAPLPPSSLLALGETERARLIWEASPSGDAVGYWLERRDPGGDFRRILEQPTTALEHLDRGLASGLTYVYRVSAVDGAGNEGNPGAEVSVTVP
jgi:predicted small lipoprotein YifL